MAPAAPVETMRGRAAAVVTELFRDDPRVAIVLAAISVDLFASATRHDSRRSINVGIMEQTMIGVAAGFAMEGFHAIAHSITPFLVERPYEQLKLDFGYQRLGGTFVSVGASYDYAAEGGTHHAPGDAGLLLQIPGFEIMAPGHPDEVETLLRASYANGRPTYLRTSVACNDRPHAVVPGRMVVVCRGAGPTVIAVGPMLERTLSAVEGTDATVLYATSIEPFDAETLLSVAGARPTVISIEPWHEGTLTSSIAVALAHVPSRIVSIGVPKRFSSNYGAPTEHDVALGLDARGIRRRIGEALAPAGNG